VFKKLDAELRKALGLVRPEVATVPPPAPTPTAVPAAASRAR
jgi:hypothetical protein